jgi:hypothetical protein
MLNATDQPPCGARCCGDTTKTHKRTAKRRERQEWKKEIRNGKV